MRTIEQIAHATVEVKRSRFLTYLVPYDDFECYHERLRSEHPKANHIVYAVRFLNEAGQVSERSSDDGEPKGCAGVPALNVLRGEELINVGALIVRYFGGIKLGTGGMARAYTQAVKEVLAVAQTLPYQKQKSHTFATSYSDADRTVYLLKQCEISTFERTFDAEGIVWTIKGSEENISKFQNRHKSIGFYGND